MKSICVFCGSNAGNQPIYRSEAEKLGRLLSARGIELVYGGGNIGLMGAVADAALEAGGEVIGVIPRKLVELEKEHRGLTQEQLASAADVSRALVAAIETGRKEGSMSSLKKLAAALGCELGNVA